MATNVKLDTKALQKLIKEIDEKVKDLDPFIDECLKEAGKILLEQEKEEVPVRTGRLKDSLKVSEIDYNNKLKKFVRVGDVEYESGYIWYVERQNGFMARAKEITRPKIRKYLKEKMLKELSK